jgi:hypothetical protein
VTLGVIGSGTEYLTGLKRTGVPENREDRCDGHKRNPENELEAHPSNGGSNLQFHEMTPAIGISSRKEK